MKKTKLLVLTAMSALLLVGCNNTKTGTLPSGGKSVDGLSAAVDKVIALANL